MLNPSRIRSARDASAAIAASSVGAALSAASTVPARSCTNRAADSGSHWITTRSLAARSPQYESLRVKTICTPCSQARSASGPVPFIEVARELSAIAAASQPESFTEKVVTANFCMKAGSGAQRVKRTVNSSTASIREIPSRGVPLAFTVHSAASASGQLRAENATSDDGAGALAHAPASSPRQRSASTCRFI